MKHISADNLRAIIAELNRCLKAIEGITLPEVLAEFSRDYENADEIINALKSIIAEYP